MSLPKFQTEWDGFKGYVKVTWDKLGDEELLRVQGDSTVLAELIASKYTQTRQEIEARIAELYKSYLAKKDELAADIGEIKKAIHSKSSAFMDDVKHKTIEFQTAAKETYEKIRRDNIEPAVQKSEDYIKLHPFAMVFGAFGVGILLGGLVTLLARRD